MSAYRVFLGAPSLCDLDNDPIDYQWKTFSSQSQSDKLREQLPTPPDFPPTQALDDASRRISLIYQNVIFNDSFDENDGSFEQDGGNNDIGGGAGAFS